EAECYHALHQIHRFWKPIDGKVRDFISFSRLNGYRCLQTEVILPFETGHIRAHFHIRTREMEKINRWGVAKWPEIQNISLPHAWWSYREELYPCLAGAEMGSLPEKLYVFSPLGEIFSFRRGDTVVDYAYMVHSEVAHQTSRFRVNGEYVSATYRLRHLDLVELERAPQASGPNRLWLTVARTSRARVHIQNFLKRRSQNSLQGRTLFDRHLQKLKDHYRIDIPDHRLKMALQQAVRKCGLNSTEDLLAEIAAGRQSSDPILHPIFSDEIVRQVQLPPDIRLTPNQMKLAQCCRPRPGESIIGRPRYRQNRLVELKIHQADCPHLAGREDTIPLSWRLRSRMNVIQRLEIEALYEQWLLQNILGKVYHYLPNVTVHKVDYQTLRGVARLSLTVEARDMDLIEQIADDIRHLPHPQVNNVRVMHLLMSEQEELVQPAATFNPYRRLPVRQREMFFGRTEELEKIYELLQQDTGVVFVRGQKRVGKTSLLYHLRNHHLPQGPFVPAFVDLQLLNVLNGPDFFYQIAVSVFDDLQKNNRLDTVGMPLRELFEDKPALELTRYLQNIQHQFAPHRLVVLIDEFSRTIDAYRRRRLDRDFFPQWRSILQAVAPAVSIVMVIQQQAFESLQEKNPRLPTADPVWPLLEMGETIILKPLDEQSARQLIERPTYNYLEYSPNALRYVWRLTGGSPFFIHAFCHDLVNYMARTGRRRVRQSDVDAVQEEFMSPVNESLFQHLLDVVKGQGWPVCQRLTQFLDETDTPVPLAEIRAVLPHLSDTRLLAIMDDLEDQHIVTRIEPDCWQFTSLLFGRWLARNTMLEQFKAVPPARQP
ncbi:MAG: TGS domain-containing protein, partial [Chloroflexi bacterium]